MYTRRKTMLDKLKQFLKKPTIAIVGFGTIITAVTLWAGNLTLNYNLYGQEFEKENKVIEHLALKDKEFDFYLKQRNLACKNLYLYQYTKSDVIPNTVENLQKSFTYLDDKINSVYETNEELKQIEKNKMQYLENASFPFNKIENLLGYGYTNEENKILAKESRAVFLGKLAQIGVRKYLADNPLATDKCLNYGYINSNNEGKK
jgi:hypothetical protein